MRKFKRVGVEQAIVRTSPAMVTGLSESILGSQPSVQYRIGSNSEIELTKYRE